MSEGPNRSAHADTQQKLPLRGVCCVPAASSAEPPRIA